MAGGTSRSSMSIEFSNHPAIGISLCMETRIQVQIIAQEPAEVESCMQCVPRFSTECCIAQEPAEVESCKVLRFSTECCSALFQEAYGSPPSFPIFTQSLGILGSNGFTRVPIMGFPSFSSNRFTIESWWLPGKKSIWFSIVFHRQPEHVRRSHPGPKLLATHILSSITTCASAC